MDRNDLLILSVLCISCMCLFVPCMSADMDADVPGQTHQVNVIMNQKYMDAGCTVEGALTYAAGETVTLVAHPAEGYHLVRWTSNDTGEEVSTSVTYSFTMPDHDLDITVQFGKHVMFGYDLGDGNHTIRCHSCDVIEVPSEPHSDEEGDLVCDVCFAHVHALGAIGHDAWIHWRYCGTCMDEVELECHHSNDGDDKCDVCGVVFEDTNLVLVDHEWVVDSAISLSYDVYISKNGSISVVSGGTLVIEPDSSFDIVGNGESIVMHPGSVLVTGDVATPIVETWALDLEGTSEISISPSEEWRYTIDVDVNEGSTFRLGGFTVTGGTDTEVHASVSTSDGISTASVTLDLPDVIASGYGALGSDVVLTDVRGTVSLEVPPAGLSMDCISEANGSIGSVGGTAGDALFTDVQVTHDGTSFDVDKGESSDEKEESDDGNTLMVAIVIAIIAVIAIAGIVILRRRP